MPSYFFRLHFDGDVERDPFKKTDVPAELFWCADTRATRLSSGVPTKKRAPRERP